MGTPKPNVWEEWELSSLWNRKENRMVTWLALEHRLCWVFGMWKVKPQTPPAPTGISLHVPLSKPESHIPPQSSPGRHSSLHVSQAVTPCYRMCSVSSPSSLPGCAPPWGFLQWDAESREGTGMRARDSSFSTDPIVMHYQLQKKGLSLSPFLAFVCSHSLCS